MVRILITGTTGFIGKCLKEYFSHIKAEKFQVYAPNHRQLDLLNKKATQKYIEDYSIDVVVHCANEKGSQSNLNKYDILHRSVQMFDSLSEVSESYKKMIYFGSGAEYDRFYGKHLITEGDFGIQIPQDSYGFTKYIQAKLINGFDNIYDLCLFGVYGKYEEWQRRFISNNIVRSLKGLPMTLSQNAMFDYLYVEDLCRIVEWFIEHEPKHKHYNVCTGQPIALQELAHMINEVSGLHREIQIAKDGWQSEYSGDNSRLLAEIGGFQFTDKKKSIEEMWNYYAEHIDEFDERQLLL